MDKPIINVRAFQPSDNRRNSEKKLEPPSIDKNTDDSSEIIIHDYKDKKIFREEMTSVPDNNEENEEQDEERNDTSIFDKYHNSNYLINKITEKSNDCSNYYQEYLAKKNKVKKQTKFDNSKILKMFITSIGAIGTGIIIGYLMLQFFTTTIEGFDVNKNNISYGTLFTSENNNLVSTGQTIDKRTVYFLQAGVFSNLSGAEAVVSKQHELGKAAVIQSADSYSVFVGLATMKDNADAFKGLFIMDNTDVYAKEYQIPEKKFSMSEESFAIFANWVNVGEQIVASLSEQSILALINSEYEIDYQQLQKLHQQFLLDVQNLKTNLNDENLGKEWELVNGMADQIYYAISAINAYEKNPNDKYLWDIQELLISYELIYSQF